MSKLIEIAKANGADVAGYVDYDNSYKTTIEFTPDQLRATIEQVCAPLVYALQRSRNLGLFDDSFINDQIFSKRTSLLSIKKALSDYRTLIGDKE